MALMGDFTMTFVIIISAAAWVKWLRPQVVDAALMSNRVKEEPPQAIVAQPSPPLASDDPPPPEPYQGRPMRKAAQTPITETATTAPVVAGLVVQAEAAHARLEHVSHGEDQFWYEKSPLLMNQDYVYLS
jgi:hypothetical protein